MPSTSEPRSGLKYGWASGESGWGAEMSANLLRLGRFAFHLSVKSRSLATPPGSPAAGDSYIVAASPTGAWVAHAGEIAIWDGAAWIFSGAPRLGWLASIEDEPGLMLIRYSGSAWQSVAGRPLIDHYADAGNTGTAETDLYSDTLAANILGRNGDKIHAEYDLALLGATTTTPQAKIYFAGTAIYDSGALTLSAAGSLILNVEIIRDSATSVRYAVRASASNATGLLAAKCGKLTGLTLSATAILKITGTSTGGGAATNDLVAYAGRLNFDPAG